MQTKTEFMSTREVWTTGTITTDVYTLGTNVKSIESITCKASSTCPKTLARVAVRTVKGVYLWSSHDYISYGGANTVRVLSEILNLKMPENTEIVVRFYIFNGSDTDVSGRNTVVYSI